MQGDAPAHVHTVVRVHVEASTVLEASRVLQDPRGCRRVDLTEIASDPAADLLQPELEAVDRLQRHLVVRLGPHPHAMERAAPSAVESRRRRSRNGNTSGNNERNQRSAQSLYPP